MEEEKCNDPWSASLLSFFFSFISYSCFIFFLFSDASSRLYKWVRPSFNPSVCFSIPPFIRLTANLSLHLFVCLSVTPVLKLCRWRIELPGWTQSFHFHFYEMFCLLFGWLVHRLFTVELKIVKKAQNKSFEKCSFFINYFIHLSHPYYKL